MLNFSQGGVYLRCGDEALCSALPQGYIPAQDRQAVLLSIPDQPFKVCAKVVYCKSGGMGLSFCDSDGDKLYAVLYAQTSESAATTDDDNGHRTRQSDQSRALLKQIEDKTLPFLEAGLAEFFAQAQQAFQHLIAETSDPQEESSLFYTLNTLEQDQATLSQRFLLLAGRNFALLAGKPAEEESSISSQPEALALVETQEVDTWILINKLARRVESDNSHNMFHVETALSYLCQDNVHNELNPIAPISLLTILKKILDGYQFDFQNTKLLLDSFCNTLLNDIGLLYEDLLQLLRQQKIAGLERESQERWTILKSPELGISDSSSPIDHLSTLNTLKSVDDDQASTISMTENERKDVMTSLASLSRLQAATLQQQVQHLLQETGSSPVDLSDEARAAIGAGEELMATLSNDPLITDELRTLVLSLKYLVVEAVLQDTSLLDNEDHPVRRLLDAIESLKPYINRGARTSLLRDQESHRLKAITEAVENSRFDHIDAVTQEIVALYQEQHARFESNRKLSISRCLKDEKLRQAQNKTYQALSNLLLRQSVSPVIDKLFRFGWVNLLIQTAVLEKTDTKAWEDYLQTVERLHRLCSDPEAKKNLTQQQQHTLLLMIHKGFTDYPIHAVQARPFEQELRQLLKDKDDNHPSTQPQIKVDEGYLQQYFQDMSHPPSTAKHNEQEKQWWKQVNEIALDTWMVYQDAGGPLRILSLAWKNPETSRYLLVDGDGYKVLDITQHEVVSLFANQQIYAMERSTQPVVERTIETILSNTYNNFKHESAIDSLTGLCNRRAFESELNQYINQAQEEAGVLLLLDLDKFQVVNDLCGFEGGDKLLQTVTDILLSYLPDKGLLGRIGDDEFTLLLHGHDLDQGYQAAEMLRLAIDEYDFEWQGRMIPATASVGVVEINLDGQRPDKLMQAALAACNLSKQWGGNCTRVYLESDATYKDHRQLVQSLPTIKEALAKGRLELFVQPIVPLQTLEGLSYHYEILLRIRNEAGELETPQAFIRAAEEYDLMRDVDRWVVEAFFRQVEPYAEKLQEGQGFSINLSGKSVGDERFKNHLIERIKASPLKTRHLGFEITETVLVGDISDTAAAIDEIRDLGCSFSLDDFGSGYASFSYLRDFPVDFVKIDGVFVREILNKPADYAMINSITEIAHFMDKQVIAEFVSDEATSAVLKSVGVDYGQGYHFGKPRPLQEVLDELVEVKEDDDAS
jgi:diguanylate cyclase (GGDEF)-like protein